MSLFSVSEEQRSGWKCLLLVMPNPLGKKSSINGLNLFPKSYNDRYEHDAGDRKRTAVSQVAQIALWMLVFTILLRAHFAASRSQAWFGPRYTFSASRCATNATNT